MSSAPTLTFVIPVYNGAALLPGTLDEVWRWLEARAGAAELLVIDDGSTDTTSEVLAAFAARVAGARFARFTTVRNARNRGKGFSLRRAFLLAQGSLVVFTDADLTYPLDNVAGILAALQNGADVAIGSRMHADSRYVVAPTFFGKLFTRHFMGRGFNLLVRACLLPGIRDTQAGMKGLRQEAARALAERVRLDRFSFDLELLFVARRLGLRLAECPVRFLYRKEPSTVRFARDSLRMLRDIALIRWRGLRGTYERRQDIGALQQLARGGVDRRDQTGPGIGRTA